jgi:hypothetical protein
MQTESTEKEITPGAARRMLAGAVAGAAATGVMSAVMWGAQRAGALGTMPPKKVVVGTLEALGVTPSSETQADLLSAGAHLLFGAGAGALYGLLAAPTLSRRVPPLVTGPLFGAAVWAVSYAGWIPGAGLMAPPHRDRPGRPTSMVIAHLVFGAVLGPLCSRLARRR